MAFRRWTLVCCAALGAAAVALSGLPSGAQLPTPLPSLSPPSLGESPSPSPSPSSTAPSQPPEGGGAEPARQPEPAPSGEVPVQREATPPAGFPLAIPDIARTPSQTTGRLADILAPLTERGMALEQAMILSAPPFPVAGLVWYSDDWLLPRIGPPPHLHEGSDIFAASGVPIAVSSPGYVAGVGTTGLGGLSVWISADDGTGFYYAHLAAFAEGLQLGQRVDLGTVIGYVGNTGNAATTPPHLHFEIHPAIRDRKGGILAGGVTTMPDGLGRTNTAAVNPKPILDEWLRQAEARAEVLVRRLIEQFARISRQLRFAQRIDQLYSVDAVERPDRLIWFSAFEPTLAALGLARQAALAADLPFAGGSFAERRAEEQRLAAVRLAVDAPKLELAALTGELFGPSEE